MLDINNIDHYNTIISNKGNGRILCIDYGDKRIGLALSDINWVIASPYCVLESSNAFHRIKTIIENNNVKIVLIGLPIALNGSTSGKQLEKVKKFVNKCDDTLSNIITWDERMSTSAMICVCKEMGFNNNKRKQNIDKMAASFILDGFLQYLHNFNKI